MGRALTLLLFVLGWWAPALALNPALDVSQYVHTSWKMRDGFFNGRITSIAQLPDGYLWLGTELGVVRFDGVRFVPWNPPSNQPLPSNMIASLLAARDGTMWIGTDQGLASWKDGTLTRYEALAGSRVFKIVEDREGTIWTTRISAKWTLCDIRKTRVTCYGDDGGPGDGAIGLYEDRAGSLWVGTLTGLWRWKPGPAMFYRLPAGNNGIQGISETSDGSLLISTAGGIKRFVDGKVEMEPPFPTSSPPLQASRLLRDRDGGLWAGTTSGGGLVHVHDGITDVFVKTDGLSSDNVSALLEDREGNIWVATLDGLDRFRESAVISYSINQGLSNGQVASVLASADGSVWLGTFDGLNRWNDGRVTIYRQRGAQGATGIRATVSRNIREINGAGMPAAVMSILEDSDRRVWLSTTRAVGYLENDRFVVLSGVPGGLIRNIVEDSQKTVWFSNPQLGLFGVARRSREVEQINLAVLKHTDPLSATAADPSGKGLWVGFFRGGVAHVAEGQLRASYTTADGLAAGRISSLYADSAATLWVAANGGLSRMKNGRIATLTSKNGLPCDKVAWVVEDASRSLWLGMACGLVRIARAQIDAWPDAAQRVQTTLFDHSDGARPLVDASYFSAPAVKSVDGKVWFVSQDGVSVVDPARLPVNRVLPPLHIEYVVVDRNTYAAQSGASLRLPPLSRDLEINYTALSLAAPEKMQFRYRLENWDRDWQDVGTRRQAFYTDLPPGNYRFRVIASNNSGIWNETAASLDFAIAPAYYQTTWFMALTVGMAVTLLWTAHRIRLRVVEQHEREISALNERLMSAQEKERTRIAGELHDGVMQEMLAVTMMLGTAKRRIPKDSDARTTLEKVEEKLVRVGTDIRQMSHDLHPPLLQEEGLPGAVCRYCEQFSATCGIPVSCDADDNARDLSRGAALNVFRILQEALGNAAKHAAATRITVRLTRSGEAVSLIVSDDGIGFDRIGLGRTGGMGLLTMRERAGQLNGTFEFESDPGRGTTIRVVIPFR